MDDTTPLWNVAPAARLLLLGLTIAAAPLAWVWLRNRRAEPLGRLRALTLVTLFLTFDLVLFGAFTRLTDSGLGCPDWPGCYGSASPIGAREEINAAQAVMPDGPVTTSKAWIEMIHRYLASSVGALILVMTVVAWVLHRQTAARLASGLPAPSPWWPTVTLLWVCMQGAFGALTVTMKLYPAIVTLHLLGGLGLLALLATQAQGFGGRNTLPLGAGWRLALVGLSALVLMQMALGGWVSTNYAVLACTDFPTCNGRWWPEMNLAEGFVLRRELGVNAQGQPLSMAALVGIHYVHRVAAYAVLAALVAVGLGLWRAARQGGSAGHELRRWGALFIAVALWQLATGVSNVVLGWPLLAAVSHTAGAAVLAVALPTLLTRACFAPQAQAGSAPRFVQSSV